MDAVVFILTLYKAIEVWRSGPSTLFEVLVRDGMFVLGISNGRHSLTQSYLRFDILPVSTIVVFLVGDSFEISCVDSVLAMANLSNILTLSVSIRLRSTSSMPCVD